MEEPDNDSPRPHYRWPWFALAALLLGAVLVMVWMTVAVQRVRQQRNPNPWTAPVK